MSNARSIIAKMIGMLGSDQDGEVLSAVRAIKRRLDAENLTFGDLKNWVAGATVEREPIRQTYTKPHTQSIVERMASEILSKWSHKLTPAEKRFVGSILMRAQLTEWFELSEKQATWFAMIYERAVPKPGPQPKKAKPQPGGDEFARKIFDELF
jgi:hypothetical protein